MIARAVAQRLAASMGQPWVVDNRAGGSGQIGMPVVARAAADGHTLTVSPASFLTTNKSVFKKLPYDPETDFAPVAQLVNQPLVLVVKDRQKYPTVAALLAAARAAPGNLTYASSINCIAPWLPRSTPSFAPSWPRPASKWPRARRRNCSD
jgi:tripartite-type tricarboxylate transporter receptor subunit TctC